MVGHEQPNVPPQFTPLSEVSVRAASQTPAEAVLHETMRAVLAVSDRPLIEATRAVAPTSNVEQVEDFPVPNAIHAGIRGYREAAFAMFNQGYPALGLNTMLTARQKYSFGENGPDAPIEPLRLGVDVMRSPEQTGVHVDVVVPSRHFADNEKSVAYDRQLEEAQPPHARVVIGDGINISQLINQVRLNLGELDLPTRRAEALMRDVDATERLLDALGALTIEGWPADKFGVREAEFQLSESQMGSVTQWLNQLHGDRPSLVA